MARYGSSLHAARAKTAQALLLLALASCETLKRADYLDRFFDPAGYYARHAQETPAGPEQMLQPITSGPLKQVHATKPWSDLPTVRSEPEPTTPAAARGTPAPEDPEMRLRQTVQQHQWLTRFWAELTPAQQWRVARQLRRTAAPAGTMPADPATAWDIMGLSDRAGLVIGSNLIAGQPVSVLPEGNTTGNKLRAAAPETAPAWQEAPQ
jgi:hypothetical protein